MAQSLFKLLKDREPARNLDVLAPSWSLPIVARMPEIRHGIASETGHGELGLATRRAVANGLKSANYGRAIILPRSFKAALIPWLAKIPQRTGFRGESRYWLINDVRPFDDSVLDQTVKRFVALGLSSSEPLPAISNPSLQAVKKHQERLLKDLGLSTERPIIAMMPGAEYGPAKCWPLQYFSELAVLLEHAGYTVWVLGSDKDAAAGAQVAATSTAINLCGRTALADVIDLLAMCEQAVSNDSGLMHIAAAVGIRVHGIYGSSSPDFTPPLTDSRHVHFLDLECSPCFERNCPLTHLKCLKDISAVSVFEAICK